MKMLTVHARHQFTELRHFALNAGLRKGVVVLNAVQQPRQTPETVRLYVLQQLRLHEGYVVCIHSFVCNRPDNLKISRYSNDFLPYDSSP